jgi:hypothetical protein
MDSNHMGTSEDGVSTRRPLRNTKARQDLEKKQQEEATEKQEQLKELEEVREDNLTNAQRKKITRLRKELRIDATSKSVDPQSKPQYPESTSGDNEERNSGRSPQTPGSGDLPSSENERPGFDNQKRNGYAGSPSNQTAPKRAPEISYEGGVAVAYCLCKCFKSNLRMIYRFGPPDHSKYSKYEFGPSKAHTKHEIDRLPLISGKGETILGIYESGRWLYGFNNIKRVVHVVTLTPNSRRKWKPRMTKKGKAIHVFPTILVRILWDQIQERHQNMLENGESWIFRGILMEKLKKKEKEQMDDWIRDAAKHQDLSYQKWLNENGATNRDRPPTFFPGADWANAPVQPRKTKSQSVRTKSNSSSGLSSQGNGSREEKSHRAGKKRARADSGADSGSVKKARPVPASTEESTKTIDYRSYLSYNMNHYKLTDEMRDNDKDEYDAIMNKIEEDWNNYRQIMIKQGYSVAPGGEKPEA